MSAIVAVQSLDRYNCGMATFDHGESALHLGETARREGRLADASVAFEGAVACFRAAGDKAKLAHALSREAQIARDTKQLDKARGLQDEAVSIARETASPSLPHLIRHLADILQDDGDAAGAAPLYDEVLALYRTSTDVPPLELANTIRSVACNAQALGDRATAIRHWRSAREQYEALDPLFRQTYGLEENPGVAEADRRLAALAT